MMLLKKRWRETKDDSCKSNCRKVESEKGITINWNIKHKVVSHQKTKEHSTKQDSNSDSSENWQPETNLWNP